MGRKLLSNEKCLALFAIKEFQEVPFDNCTFVLIIVNPNKVFAVHSRIIIILFGEYLIKKLYHNDLYCKCQNSSFIHSVKILGRKIK